MGVRGEDRFSPVGVCDAGQGVFSEEASVKVQKDVATGLDIGVNFDFLFY